MTAEKIAELKRWLVIAQQPYNPRYKAAKRDAQARVTRFVPELIAALEAAEAERDRLEEMYMGSEGIMPDGELGPTKHNMGAWLAARDARLKAEGAAEVWDQIAKIGGIVTEQAISVTVAYAEEQAEELRRKGING